MNGAGDDGSSDEGDDSEALSMTRAVLNHYSLAFSLSVGLSTTPLARLRAQQNICARGRGGLSLIRHGRRRRSCQWVLVDAYKARIREQYQAGV